MVLGGGWGLVYDNFDSRCILCKIAYQGYINRLNYRKLKYFYEFVV